MSMKTCLDFSHKKIILCFGHNHFSLLCHFPPNVILFFVMSVKNKIVPLGGSYGGDRHYFLHSSSRRNKNKLPLPCGFLLIAVNMPAQSCHRLKTDSEVTKDTTAFLAFRNLVDISIKSNSGTTGEKWTKIVTAAKRFFFINLLNFYIFYLLLPTLKNKYIKNECKNKDSNIEMSFLVMKW